MTTLAGHQARAFDAKHPWNSFQCRFKRTQLSIKQLRDMQVDGIALLAANFAPRDIYSVVSKLGHYIAKNTDTVLTVKF